MCARRSPSAPKLQGVGKPSSDGWWYLPPITPRWRGRRHFFSSSRRANCEGRRRAAARAPRRRHTPCKLRAGELRACSTEHQLAAQMLDQSPQLGDFGRARLSLSRASSVGARRRDCLRSRVAPSRRSASARSSPNVVRYTRHTRFGLSVCGSTMSIIAAPLAMLSELAASPPALYWYLFRQSPRRCGGA